MSIRRRMEGQPESAIMAEINRARKGSRGSVSTARKHPDRRQTSMPITNPRAAQAKVDLAEKALAREQAAHAAATNSHAKAVAKVRVQRAQELLDRRKQEYRDKFS